MTALDQYEKLEATAVWRAGADAQRRDVYVSLGEATLVIHDGKEVALGHWSLPAVQRRNPGKSPAIFAPDIEAPEELEIADETMIAAIERVRRAVERSRPHKGRLRFGLVAALGAAIFAALVFWMPEALLRQTASIVPPASRAAIGDALIGHLRPFTGAACRTSAGDLALARMKARLLPDGTYRIAVVPSAVSGATHLPGGTLLIGRAVVEDHETPEVAAGYVLAEVAKFENEDPLIGLLRASGIGSTLALLTRGEIPDEALATYARELLASGEDAFLDPTVIAPLFARADVPIEPYAYALDPTGETVLDLIEVGAAIVDEVRPILSDDNWVALQNICGGAD